MKIETKGYKHLDDPLSGNLIEKCGSKISINKINWVDVQGKFDDRDIKIPSPLNIADKLPDNILSIDNIKINPKNLFFLNYFTGNENNGVYVHLTGFNKLKLLCFSKKLWIQKEGNLKYTITSLIAIIAICVTIYLGLKGLE